MNDIYNKYLDKAYRYLSFDSLHKTIENENLRLTRVDQFNDPLDNSPFLAPMDWEMYKSGGNGFIKIAEHHIFSKVFSSMYICCFCKEYKSENSYLMWSHYGKAHSQVCFELDFSKINYLSSPSEVKYPDSLVIERDRMKSKSSEELGLFVVTNKLKKWSYEKEVRLIVDIMNPKIKFSDFKSSNDSKFLYANFDLKNISKVIFGINAERIKELETIKLFATRNLNPTFEKMFIDPETLKLESREYNDKEFS
ncbi:hypothetical protein ES708_09768 [subsurface metagenome]